MFAVVVDATWLTPESEELTTPVFEPIATALVGTFDGPGIPLRATLRMFPLLNGLGAAVRPNEEVLAVAKSTTTAFRTTAAEVVAGKEAVPGATP